MIRKLRWGVISTSNIARVAVNPAIKASHNGELIAVASRSDTLARIFAKNEGIPTYYGSYKALLEDERIEAVYNPLPNSMHKEWTIKAAEKGKHILCEKPLALSAVECNEMEAAAKANGVLLMEAFMYRFHPQIQKMLELIKGGTIGELRLIRNAFTFRLTNPDNIRTKHELGGGSLMDVGCYCVNISRTITGQEPTEVQAIAHWYPSGVDEQMVGTLRFENGVFAQFDCALSIERREMCEVVGTVASLRISGAFLPGKNDTIIFEHRARGKVIEHIIKGVDEYQLMVEHFSNCVLKDKPLHYTPAEASLNMQAIEALYKSPHSAGRWVSV